MVLPGMYRWPQAESCTLAPPKRPGCTHHVQQQVRRLSQGLASGSSSQRGTGKEARRGGGKGMNKTALLIGGLGLGAGLIYILDPERGERRRAMALAQLERYRRHTDDLWDHTTRSLGRQARELFTRAPLARRYRRRGPGELLLARAEQLGILKSMLMLGCTGLGVGMMYVLDPRLGRRRRALVRDKAQAYWRRTGNFISQTARDARQRTYGLIAETRTQLRGADVPEET